MYILTALILYMVGILNYIIFCKTQENMSKISNTDTGWSECCFGHMVLSNGIDTVYQQCTSMFSSPYNKRRRDTGWMEEEKQRQKISHIYDGQINKQTDI